MKVKRMLAVNKELFKRLSTVCEEQNFYRNSFVTAVIESNLDKMNEFSTCDCRIRLKEKKARFQIYISEEVYNSIKDKKIQRIEKILDEELRKYENK